MQVGSNLVEIAGALGLALQRSQTRLDFGVLAQRQGSPAERVLLERCEESLSLLQSFPVTDQQLIRSVLDTITSGQELDLCRFAAASATNIVALQTDETLDEYTYRVAGCVGRFWTDMCVAHVFSRAELEILRPSLSRFERLGISCASSSASFRWRPKTPLHRAES